MWYREEPGFCERRVDRPSLVAHIPEEELGIEIVRESGGNGLAIVKRKLGVKR